jgi:hypothetical protein
LIFAGSPIGWGAYTGHVDIVRYLCGLDADAMATDDVLWTFQPPLLVAASNSKLEVMKFLVDECGQDIRMRDPRGVGILQTIESSSNWKEIYDHTQAHKWAKKILQRQQVTARGNTFKR